MKCKKCKSEWNEKTGVIIENCPFCQAKLAMIDEQTPEQKMKYISKSYHIIEVYNSSFNFCNVIDENFKDKQDYNARLLKFLAVNNASKLVLKLKGLPQYEIKAEFDKIVSELEYSTFTTPEILIPAVTLLCIGLGIEVEGLEKTSHLADFEIVDGVLNKYLGYSIFVTVPDTVTAIGDFAFYGSEDLTEVTLPNTVTSIGESAFDSCDFLKRIILSNSLNSIDDFAFADCNSLLEVNIPDSVTEISRSAFKGCCNLNQDTVSKLNQLGYIVN